jgi:ankyrin repeat protein
MPREDEISQYAATSGTALSGQYATAILLLEHGADALVRQAHGITPVHEGAVLGRADLVEPLLANGAEMNSIDDAGRTPPAFAIKEKHDELVTMMKAKGARLEAKEEE